MHGSYIRNLRLEAKKPTPVPFDTVFHFGASTRSYILKGECSSEFASSSFLIRSSLSERPNVAPQRDDAKTDEDSTFDLPQEEEELDVRMKIMFDHVMRSRMR